MLHPHPSGSSSQNPALLTLACPIDGDVIVSVEFASFGRPRGTCEVARSPTECVAEARRWCESCDKCKSFATYFSEKAQFHSCESTTGAGRGNNWDSYFRSEAFGTRHGKTNINSTACPIEHVLPTLNCNENRTSGVFSADPDCSAPGARATAERLCLGKPACTLDP